MTTMPTCPPTLLTVSHYSNTQHSIIILIALMSVVCSQSSGHASSHIRSLGQPLCLVGSWDLVHQHFINPQLTSLIYHSPTLSCQSSGNLPGSDLSRKCLHLLNIQITVQSITAVLTRILERLVVRQYIYSVIVKPPTALSISDLFAYGPTGSTTAATITILHTVTQFLASNPHVIVIAIGLSKAFDTVRHQNPVG